MLSFWNNRTFVFELLIILLAKYVYEECVDAASSVEMQGNF